MPGNIRVEYDFTKEELTLICSVEANPGEGVVFMWEKDNMTFEGQDNHESLETEVTLRMINESLGWLKNIWNNSFIVVFKVFINVMRAMRSGTTNAASM